MAVPAGTVIALVVSNSLVRMPPDLLESLLAGCAASVELDLHPVTVRVAARMADSAMEPRTLLLGILTSLFPAMRSASCFPKCGVTNSFLYNEMWNSNALFAM